MPGKTKEITVKNTVEEVGRFIPGMSWDDLTANAHEVIGSDLAKGDMLDALEGIPFLIHRVTFRKSDYIRPDGTFGAVLAAECVIAPEEVLTKRRVDMATLPFEPGGQVVFNDASTGVYRQIVAYLSAVGIVELPTPLVENGPLGTTSYDLPPGGWDAVSAGELTYTEDGWANYVVDVRLKCPRGIRVSGYENAHTKDGKTRYLA